MGKIQYKQLIYWFLLGCVFLFGIYIRTKLYITNGIFEDDECRLALSMRARHLYQMFLPLGALSAAPIFMFVSKIIGFFSNYNEYALKFIPYIASIISIFYFYKLCNSYFNRKISVLLGVYFLTINKSILYFSSVFKQYSIEYLFTILCLYYFPKLDIGNLKIKQTLILAIILSILPMISLPTLYFIGVFFLINLFQNFKNKDFYKKFAIIITPFIIVLLGYYIFNLHPTKILQYIYYGSTWKECAGMSFLQTAAIVLKLLFEPNMFILFFIILFISFGLFTIFKKSEYTKINIYLLSVPIIAVLSSMLNLYYIIIGRTAVFLIPLLILVMIRPVDIKFKNKIPTFIFSILFFISFLAYFIPAYDMHINEVDTTFRNFAPDNLMQELKKRYNPETDIVIFTEPSTSSFLWYTLKYETNISNYMQMNVTVNDTRENVFKLLNDLSPKKKYWFYLIKEYKKYSDRKYILEWAESQNILYSKKDRDSYLLYISPTKKVMP